MKKFVIMGVILGLGSFLRLYNLANYPAGLNADEAALGYNAYSLLQTGRDEHGHPWPINFESFGDFKPALYGYILIPFIKVLGLTPLAVRLPSAIAGIFSILVIYWLTKEILSEKIAYLAALYLAISPWHLHFSRGGWEVNLASTFILIALFSIFKWLRLKRFLYLGICILGFVLSMYTYQSARIISPLLGLGIFLLFPREFWQSKKQLILTSIFGLIILLPLIYTFVFSNAISRASGVGLLADQGPIDRVNELRGQHAEPNFLLVKVLHNRLVAYSLAFVENYTDHFNGDFLFGSGDVIERNRVPETGLLYWTDSLFLVLGAIYLIRNQNNTSKFVWLWLLLAPLAAGLTFQTPHALRSQMMIFPLTILIAAGIYTLFKKLNFQLLLLLLLLVYGWQATRYLHEYYVHYPKTYPAAWEYGFDQVLDYVLAHQSDYNQVLVTTKYDQPYILFLFYSHYPPQKFQTNHQLTVRDKFNFSTVNEFDKYKFTDTDWEKVRDMHSALIVAAPENIPDTGVDIVKTINFPSGLPAFKIISN